MNIVRKPIKSWVNKRGDGQFTPNHQSSCNDRNDTQVFHHEFLPKLLVRSVYTRSSKVRIVARVKCFTDIKSSNAISDAEHLEKFHRSPSIDPSDAIISINGNNSGI